MTIKFTESKTQLPQNFKSIRRESFELNTTFVPHPTKRKVTSYDMDSHGRTTNIKYNSNTNNMKQQGTKTEKTFCQRGIPQLFQQRAKCIRKSNILERKSLQKQNPIKAPVSNNLQILHQQQIVGNHLFAVNRWSWEVASLRLGVAWQWMLKDSSQEKTTRNLHSFWCSAGTFSGFAYSWVILI